MPRMPDDMAARYGAILEEYDASIKLLNESKAETLTELRGELKALGYQGAEIGAEVAMLKAAVKELGMTQVERQKADDKDEGVSDYVTILSLARARAHARDEEHDDDGVVIEPASGLSNSQADRRPESTEQSAGANAEERAPASSAPIQPETAAQTVATPMASSPLAERGSVESSATDEVSAFAGATIIADQAEITPVANQAIVGANSLGSAADKSESGGVSPALSAPTYAAPGIVVMERCPPVGIVAHPYAACWPVNQVDVTGGIREPIVKIEQFILDGRGRYFAAREAGIEYPVVQYDGSDPLLDCIRWNLASRPGKGAWREIVAHKLCKLEPDRADEIMALFSPAEERLAAE